MSEELYRGVFRLRKNNREDEIIYQYLENRPSGVSRNEMIRRALLEYIQRSTNPEDNSLSSLEKKLGDMEEKILNAIQGVTITKSQSPQEVHGVSEEVQEATIPTNALSFLTNLNKQQ